jgi:hypothetical protein
VTDALTGAPLEAQIVVSQVHSPLIGPRMTDQFNGKYWRLLNAGSYSVTATAEDHYGSAHAIYVNASGWTTLDFQLQPDPAGVDPGSDTALRLVWADTPLQPGRFIHYRVDRSEEVGLWLLDLNGRRVRTLVDERQEPGVRSIGYKDGLPAGGYLLLLRTGDTQTARKVVVVE